MTKTLPLVEQAVTSVEVYLDDHSHYGNGHGYWDDYALAHFLYGVCMRFIAYPVSFLPSLVWLALLRHAFVDL